VSHVAPRLRAGGLHRRVDRARVPQVDNPDVPGRRDDLGGVAVTQGELYDAQRAHREKEFDKMSTQEKETWWEEQKAAPEYNCRSR
jgi:hypothetical protein